ncbi:MAG TPA: N-acetylmuramoyl-L-alanine amidase [Acetobacteraceae bacterium]|nr:N-acetylmuramoyl-L-alanine amidase [Acetobacteraceae bacterium]
MVIHRRVLLGAGVRASFVLPVWMQAALARAAAPRPPGLPLPPPPPPRPPGRKLPPLVMLDPGHGGRDPGAIGVSGTYEKHIALDAAYDLKRVLEQSGYRVMMTRWKDIFIPLETRVGIAQQNNATLFVSMHADAIYDHQVRGASVYTLSNTASDAQTAQLAATENASDRFAGPGFHGVSPQVAQILASLVQQETRVGSATLQQDMVRNLGNDVKLLANPARHAAFVVLKSAEIPSVLVEMGFMSNLRDEMELRTVAHRMRIAAAMKSAVDAWFVAHRVTRMAG